MTQDTAAMSAPSAGSTTVPFAPYYQDEAVTIYNADCRKVLPFLERFDLLLTDPPYGIGDKWADGVMDGKRGSSRLWGHGENWDRDTAPDWLIRYAESLAADSIIWGGNYYGLRGRCWLIWDKVQSFSGADAELAFTTLDKPVRAFRMSRIDAYQNCSDDKKSHPTQKPLPLIRWCLGLVPDAATVLDPFMGSGTTLVAAKLEGRKAVGIEISEKYCEAAANRLRQGVLF